jgi:WD domain, G-beta repeat/WD40-like Beta Propeller Repeat
MQSWQAHERSIVSLAFAPAGCVLATAAEDEPGVRLWDLTEGAVQRELAVFAETATRLAFSPAGKLLAAGRPWGVELWDPATGEQRLILEGHRHFSRSLSFSADGTSLLSAGMRLGGRWLGAPQAIIWNLNDGRVTAEFVGQASDMPNLIWALDATAVVWVRPGVTEKSDPVVTITDVQTGKPRVLFESPGPFREPALSPDGMTLAGAVRGDLVLWSLADLTTSASISLSTRWRRWLTGSTRAAAPPLRPRLTLSAGAERIDAVAFTPDGRRVMAGTAAGTVRVWDLPDLAEETASAPQGPREVFQWGIGPLTTLAVAADGLTAAAGGATGRVVVWDVEG